MSGEEVERKADPEAENERIVREEDPNWSTDEPEQAHKGIGSSAVGDLLTDLSVGWTTVARLSLAFLLFGGIGLTFAGAGLWVEETLGTYATMVVTGVGALVLSYILAQVYARRGWI